MQTFIENSIREAGAMCEASAGNISRDQLSFKNAKDLVTETDRQVELYLTDQIRKQFPGHGIHGEETGISNPDSRHRWIIDPIDGTTSFFHGQPFYAVSIALEIDSTVEYGAVYAPALNELFFAQRGKGACLNGEPVHVSHTRELIDAVLATGFACLRAGAEPNNLPVFNAILPKIRDIRRYGSAAIDLCYVACGKLDGFWEMHLNIYDIAAGTLMVKEAGGRVCDFDAGQAYPQNGIIASNPFLLPALLSFV
ncbi:MAG: inositol monophosphatase [Desulfobacteraceae bacterium]|nr:MAG: inositol monophosphatase [Desulfobacteraceae bacterium]